MQRRPPAVSAQEACTLPSTWSTVHAVSGRAVLRSRRSLLLHAATGGVGLVAMEYSAWLSVPVYASAGQPQKHRLVRGLGAVASCSSRNAAALANGVLRHLARSRLHSAINSLIDDLVATSFAVLSEDGSFQEIGKRGAWSVPRMTAARGVHLSVLDLAADMQILPYSNALLSKLANRLANCVAHGLPLTEFSISKVHDAFFVIIDFGVFGKMLAYFGCVKSNNSVLS